MKLMTTLQVMVLAALNMLGGLQSAYAQGSPFTYQGKLTDGCCPASGLYDFIFKVFDSPGGNTQQGSTFTTNGVPVTNGLFTVRLDFGNDVFTGPPRWLQIEARTNNAALTPVLLSPRTELTPTPYAWYAPQAGGVPNGAITPAMISSSGALAGQSLTFNGSSVAWATGSGIWSLNGANAYYNGGNVGIGTATPHTQLEIKSGLDTEVLRIGYSPTDYHYISASFNGGANPFANYLGFNLEYTSSDIRRVMTLRGNGNVGIGTSSPELPLDVAGNAQVQGYLQLKGAGNPVVFYNPGQYNFRLQAAGDFSSRKLSLIDSTQGNPQFDRLTIDAAGNVGIGTATPSGKLHVFGDAPPGASIPSDTTVLASGDGFHNRFMSVNGNQAVYLSMFNAGYGEISTYDYGTGQGLPLKLNQNGGTVSVPVLEITGGSDLAEPFQMSSKDLPKGALVTIDEENPGQLKMSDRAYDTRIAGIISGANGVKPGIQLHQEGVLEGGQNVALSGRVYALADAANAPIRPGDLLTTSATLGHCMKATDHGKAQGAIIGKAMSSLESGKGMVLVLVSLQ